jgi:hypothetical protein
MIDLREHPDGRAWANSTRSAPRAVERPITVRFADDLVAALQDYANWRREYQVRNPESRRVEMTSASSFERADQKARFSRFEAVHDEDHHLIPGLMEFMASLSQGEVARYLEQNYAVEALADQPLFDVARYRRGDFLKPHHDADGRRVIGFVFYLSPDEWLEGCGGEFGYRNESGEIFRIPPRHDTATLMLFRRRTRHWVEPVHGSYTRYAIAAHYLRRGSAA